MKPALLMRLLCALSFIVFAFAYMYFYQADVMMATQHLLSGGQTHYEPTIGALLITIALYVLHLGVLAVTKLTHRAHALTYFPSLLALAALTGIHVHNDGTYNFGFWLPASVVLLVAYVAVVVFLRKSDKERQDKLRLKPLPLLWTNLLLMVLMFLFVGLSSNDNDVFHYRMKAESCLLRHDYDGALDAGRTSLACDSNLTLLRIHALAHKRQLGERLFEYPLCGGSQVMLPNGRNVRPVFYPSNKMVRYPALDFQLCQCLLDRDLDGFAQLMKQHAASIDLASLPKHYREALVLYNHLRATPVISYQHDVADADYEDFLAAYRSEKDPRRRMTKLRDLYRNTYWYYYYADK